MKIIITENKIHNFFKKRGLTRTIGDLGGIRNFTKTFNLKTPNDLLDLYKDLEIVESEDRTDLILYRFNQGENVFIYDKNKNEVLVNFWLWSVLESFFDESYMRVQLIIEKWLSNTYDNLKGVEAFIMPENLENVI